MDLHPNLRGAENRSAHENAGYPFQAVNHALIPPNKIKAARFATSQGGQRQAHCRVWHLGVATQWLLGLVCRWPMDLSILAAIYFMILMVNLLHDCGFVTPNFQPNG